MLFTYTDKDGFVPPSGNAGHGDSRGGGGGLTTGNGGPLSYLEEAVTNMPRKTATSSLEATRGGDGGGGAAGGVNKTGVSETAAVIQTHLAREDKFKVLTTISHGFMLCGGVCCRLDILCRACLA